MSQQAAAPTPVVLLKWNEYRRGFRWRPTPDNAGWGQHVMEYPTLDAGPLRGTMLMLPPGQASALRAEDTDSVFVVVEGELEFDDGKRQIPMKALDVIGVRARAPYRMMNCGLGSALVFFIRSAEPAEDAGADAGPYAPMLWESYRREFRWGLPFADQWGYHRGSGPHLRTGTLSGHTVRQPPGQSAPWHSSARDLLFVQLRGEVEFDAAGRSWHLEPRDIYMMKARTPYRYTNIGLEETVFFDMGGKVVPGKGSFYFAEDPGWPVRADARILETKRDEHGQARLQVDFKLPPR